MGRIILKKIEIVATLSEFAGYKTGIVLNREEIESHLPEENELWNGPDDGYISVRSEVYEEMLVRLLDAMPNCV